MSEQGEIRRGRKPKVTGVPAAQADVPSPLKAGRRRASKPAPVSMTTLIEAAMNAASREPAAAPEAPASVLEPGFQLSSPAEPVAAPADSAAAPAVAISPQPAVPAAAETVTPDPSVPPTATPLQKGFASMATPFSTTQFGGERMQTMFGDMNDRAKSAMEKSAKLAEDMTEFTKGNVEALVASTRVAAKGAESLGQDMAESARKQFETATATMKSFVAAKSPTELLQLQSDYAKSYFDTLVAETSKLSESMLKLAGEVAQPISSRFAVAAEKIKTPVL